LKARHPDLSSDEVQKLAEWVLQWLSDVLVRLRKEKKGRRQC
jgi:hypothetical protein